MDIVQKHNELELGLAQEHLLNLMRSVVLSEAELSAIHVIMGMRGSRLVDLPPGGKRKLLEPIEPVPIEDYEATQPLEDDE